MPGLACDRGVSEGKGESGGNQGGEKRRGEGGGKEEIEKERSIWDGLGEGGMCEKTEGEKGETDADRIVKIIKNIHIQVKKKMFKSVPCLRVYVKSTTGIAVMSWDATAGGWLCVGTERDARLSVACQWACGWGRYGEGEIYGGEKKEEIIKWVRGIKCHVWHYLVYASIWSGSPFQNMAKENRQKLYLLRIPFSNPAEPCSQFTVDKS